MYWEYIGNKLGEMGTYWGCIRNILEKIRSVLDTEEELYILGIYQETTGFIHKVD